MLRGDKEQGERAWLLSYLCFVVSGLVSSDALVTAMTEETMSHGGKCREIR
jgi:hypothetical protein